MSDERRGCPRIPAVIDSEIHYQNLSYPCKVRNISLSGAYIHIRSGSFRLNDKIELGVPSYHAPSGMTQQLSGSVKRITEDGAGIKFDQLEKKAYFTLVDLVYAS